MLEMIHQLEKIGERVGTTDGNDLSEVLSGNFSGDSIQNEPFPADWTGWIDASRLAPIAVNVLTVGCRSIRFLEPSEGLRWQAFFPRFLRVMGGVRL